MSAFSLREKMILMVSILRVLQAACPPGWLTWQDSCYILLPDKMNWYDAKKACDRPGVGLVLPNSMEEDRFLWKTMELLMREFGANRGDLQFWIDCIRNDTGQFQCSGDGGTTAFRNWADDRPTNQDEEDCVKMTIYRDGRWANRPCATYYFVAVCEMSAVSNVRRRSGLRYIHVPQKCLLNHQIKNYLVKESIVCGLACWAEPLCRSFNLRKQAGNDTICQLNYASRMEADVTDIKYEENCYFYEP